MKSNTPSLDDTFGQAVRTGRNVALAVAIRRFRDEYRWTEKDVRDIAIQVVRKIEKFVERDLDTIAGDLTRMSDMGRDDDQLRECIIASLALIGAQVSESFERSRQAERN